MIRRSLAAVAVASMLALAAAACGGNSSGNDGSGTSPPVTAPTTANGQPATIGAVPVGGLGTILVDSNGRTIYLFQQDSRDHSTCSGACATAWPPVRDSGKPVVGVGTNASLVGTISRSDGSPQVTYNGHPLYLFDGDQGPGDTNGQGVTAFGAAWFAVSSSGSVVSGNGSSTGGSGGTY